MALTTYVTVWFGYANVFIATFIMVYAYLFLKQTNAHRDRRPWDFLFIASFLYMVFQVSNMVFLSGSSIFGIQFDATLVSNLMAFLYSGCVLLAFVSQHDLILRSQLILISKKDKNAKTTEEQVEVKIGLPEKKVKK